MNLSTFTSIVYGSNQDKSLSIIPSADWHPDQQESWWTEKIAEERQSKPDFASFSSSVEDEVVFLNNLIVFH